MGGLELRPRDHVRREEGQLLAGELPDYRLTGELLPPGLGLAVPHYKVAVTQVARGAEVVDDSLEPPVEDDGGVAQGTEGYRHGYPGHDVVHDLVPDEYLEGIGPGVSIDLEGDDGFQGSEPAIGVLGRDELGVIYRGIPSRGGPPDIISL